MEARGLKSGGAQPLFGEFGRGGGGGPMRGRGFWGGGAARPGPYDRPSPVGAFGRGGGMMGGGGYPGGPMGGMGFGGRVNRFFYILYFVIIVRAEFFVITIFSCL